MSGSMFLSVLRVELLTILRRRSGQFVLVMAFGIGVVAVFAMGATQNMADSGSVTIQGADLGSMVTVSGPDAAKWALRMRNFFVLPMLLLLAVGASIATEIADHTMRERLVRAVPRWFVLLNKLLALMALSVMSLMATFVPAIVGGVLRFGAEGPLGSVVLGYGATVLSDLAIIAMGALFSTVFRGSAGVVVGGIMVLLGDWVLRMLLTLLGFMGLQEPAVLLPYLPGSALECWKGMEAGWTFQPFLALAVYVGLCLSLAVLRFGRMVIP